MHAKDHEVGAPFSGDAKDFVVRLAADDDLLDVERRTGRSRDDVAQAFTDGGLAGSPISWQIDRRADEWVVGRRRELDRVEHCEAGARLFGECTGVTKRRHGAIGEIECTQDSRERPGCGARVHRCRRRHREHGSSRLAQNLLGDRAQHQPFDARSPVGSHDDEVGGHLNRVLQNLTRHIVGCGCDQCDRVSVRLRPFEKPTQVVDDVRAFPPARFERTQAGRLDIGKHR